MARRADYTLKPDPSRCSVLHPPLAFFAPSGNIGPVWNLRRTVAWLILLPLAILAALILSLPLILNSADYQALLISQAQDQLGRKVEMKRAHVEVFPYVRMTLDDVVIREADGQDELDRKSTRLNSSHA